MLKSHFSIIISLAFYIISAQTQAKLIKATDKKAIWATDRSKIILHAIFEDIGIAPDESPSPPPEKKETVKKDSSKKSKQKITPPPSTSKGKEHIKEMMRKNREKIKALHRAQKEEERNRRIYKKDFLSKYKSITKKTYKSWKNKTKETYARWKRKQKEFLKNLPHYKKNLIVFESDGSAIPPAKLKKGLNIKLLKKTAKNMDFPNVKYHLIPQAFDIPVRNQGRRPTCAAFAGIRGIETILWSNKKKVDLSEQYFYWASKPKCQASPCSKRGSWVAPGFSKGRQANSPDIPQEKDCPYNSRSVSGNETQLPLYGGCHKGIVKIATFKRLSTLDDILLALNNNRPVVGGFKLTPNFYKTGGIVTYKDSLKKGEMDSHSKGHALLIIGHIQLPNKMRAQEGSVCFIVANSWDEGWGKGGYSCLTENWIKENRINNAFISIHTVEIAE